MTDQAKNAATALRVWDLPTRVFHWLLATAVICALISAWIGGNAMVWHMRFGLSVLALLLFRLVWGFVGGRWSRFASFIYAPVTVLRYLRGEVRAGDHFEVGHNPVGSFSVFAMLALLGLQVATGVVADDEIATQGPLNRFVAKSLATLATGWHADIGSWVLVALSALHVAAILYYLLSKKTNLLRPMVSGDKLLTPATPASKDSMATRGLALVLGAACAAFAIWISRLGD